MTTQNGSPTTSASNIESVSALALDLYRKARTAGPDFADIATAVRALHTVLKHLRAEAEDPDSLLNLANSHANGESSQYARQLAPIVEDSDFTLKQLDTIIGRYGDVAGSADGPRRAKQMESREKDMMALIRTKLANQKTNIDLFLDTVQLHNPAKPRGSLENANDQQLNAIKDKVDAIAAKLFHGRDPAGSEDDEELWQQFRAELEKSGFASDVLRRNKEVLRAYIRELDSHAVLDNRDPPSVRGLLNDAPHPPPPPPATLPPMTITPASYLDNEIMVPKERVRSIDTEKFSPIVKQGRNAPVQAPPPFDSDIPQSLQPYHRSQPPAIHNQDTGLSYEPYPSQDSSDSDSHISQELALISTRDLMAFDHAERMATRMGALHLSPTRPPNYNYYPLASADQRFLPPPSQPIPTPDSAPQALPPEHELSSSPTTQQLLSSSPRYVPPVAPYPTTLSPTWSSMTPPPAYGTSPMFTPTTPLPSSAPPAGGAPVSNQLQTWSRLAPDSKGNDIPLDATWTKINRKLVSPVILERAGVRYEARPNFVAVLGILSREQIAEYARQSAEERRSRRGDTAAINNDVDRGADRRRRHHPVQQPSPRRNETYHDRDLRRRRAGPASDSDSDVLWDDSDTTNDDHDDGRQRRKYSRDRKRQPAQQHVSSDQKDRRYGGDDKGGSGGTRVYPVIVPAPGAEKTSPASTVQPKPILKNRNENHVRFDESGPREISPEELAASRAPRARDSARYHRDDRDRDRDGDRRRRDRDRDRDGERDRDRDHRRYHGRDRDRPRDRDRDRDRESRRDDQPPKKSTLRDTISAAGIGSAAASLFTVLTEAAADL